MYEKPVSTTIKDFLIAQTSEDLSIPLDVVETVIRFQGEDMLKAFKEHAQVEISGFGVLFVAKGKLKKRIDRYSQFLENGKEKDPEHEQSVRKLLEYLKNKECQNSQN